MFKWAQAPDNFHRALSDGAGAGATLGITLRDIPAGKERESLPGPSVPCLGDDSNIAGPNDLISSLHRDLAVSNICPFGLLIPVSDASV